MSNRIKLGSCISKFNCTETVTALCDDSYVYTCAYFKPQYNDTYNFSRYCVSDKDRCGVCSSFEAKRDAMIYLLKTEYGLGVCRWNKIITPSAGDI